MVVVITWPNARGERQS